MPYLGSDPGAITDAFTDTFTGDASDTTFTLTQVSTTNAVFVRIHGVVQRNGVDFSVDGTTITFTTAPPAASNNVVVQYFTAGSIQTVADNAITLAKLAGGTDGNLISFDASGDPVAVATGNDGQVLTSAGAGAAPAFEAIPATAARPTLATEQASTSGTSITFSSIPAGTKLIYVTFNGSSQNGSDFLVQLGDAGGVETASYVSASDGIGATTASTAGFVIRTSDSAGETLDGHMLLTLSNASSFNWVMSSVTEYGVSTIRNAIGGGTKALSAELDRVVITSSSGSATFDAGAISIQYF